LQATNSFKPEPFMRLMSQKRASTLIIGVDESNHAGANKKGEIVVASFSYFLGDEEKISCSSEREFYTWLELFNHPPNFNFLRDFRFALLMGRKYNQYSNLPYTLPFLVKDFLKTRRERPDLLHIHLDGHLEREDKERMESEISKLTKCEIKTKNYIKKRFGNLRKAKIKKRGGSIIRTQKIVYKGRYCPKIVVISHLIANNIYSSGTIEERLKDSRYIPIA
jgi:hypothetical protein